MTKLMNDRLPSGGLNAGLRNKSVSSKQSKILKRVCLCACVRNAKDFFTLTLSSRSIYPATLCLVDNKLETKHNIITFNLTEEWATAQFF